MTKQSCTICKNTKNIKETTAGELCPTCLALSERIAQHPEILKQLARAAGLHQTPPAQAPIEIPDVLDSIRYRTADRDRNTWYVSVSELEGQPVEIFASSAFENEHQLQSRLSNLTSITRLTSLILRHIFIGEELSLHKVVTQLRRSSRQPNDIPEMLAKILANYKKEGGKSEQEEEILP